SKGGRTVLFVSHNMLAVAALCEKIVWVEAGKILDYGKARFLIEKYNAQSSQSSLNEMVPFDQKPRTGTGAAKFTRMVICSAGVPDKFSKHIVTGESLEINLEIASTAG